jgi:hypothetical protein
MGIFDDEVFDELPDAETVVAVPVKQDIRTIVELAIASIEQDTPLDDVKAAIVLFDSVEQWLKGQKDVLNEKLIPILKACGGFEIGNFRYFAGKTKPSWKCLDVGDTMKGIFRAAETVDADTGEIGVDWPKVVECLSTNAYKPATTRKLLGKEADKFFKLPEPSDKVEVEKVQKINTDFAE